MERQMVTLIWSDFSRKKPSGSGKWGGSEILDWWDYRRNRISFNFVCSFLSARGPRPSSRWFPVTNLLTGIPKKDPDRCPVRISAGTCENTGVHSRGKWHQRARLLCLITNHFIHSKIYEDGTIEQPLLTRNWVLSPFNNFNNKRQENNILYPNLSFLFHVKLILKIAQKYIK